MEINSDTSEEMGAKNGRSKKSANKRPNTLVINNPLAKRRNVVLPRLAVSPKPTNEGKIPPTPRAPSRAKKASRLNSHDVKTKTAKALYADQVKENPGSDRIVTRSGRIFMGSTNSSAESCKPQRLFFNLGGNLYLDKTADKSGQCEGALRLSLWNINSIDKLQRVGARFSIVLNFDAIMQIKQEAEDIKTALSLCDNENFMGFQLSLGSLSFLTVEADMCSVSLRKWYKPACARDDPEGELRPSREGIRLNYEQFKKFVEFLDNQLLTEFPSYSTHVFCCDKVDHLVKGCTMCNVQGLLPMQREFRRLLDDWYVS